MISFQERVSLCLPSKQNQTETSVCEYMSMCLCVYLHMHAYMHHKKSLEGGGQKAHEKMLNITNYQRNANQNYSEVSPHTGQNGHHQKVYKQ